MFSEQLFDQDNEEENLEEQEEQAEHEVIPEKKVGRFFRKQRIEELEAQIEEYEEREKNLREELNKKFLATIKRKSEEAASLIKNKEKEIEQKYSSKFEEKAKFMYEKQMTNLVGIVTRLENVINADVKDENIKKYLLGFKMFLKQFEDLFVSLNIDTIVPEVNQEFDSEIMESVETVPASENDKRNKIVEVFSKCYKLNKRIIQLAQVKVAV